MKLSPIFLKRSVVFHIPIVFSGWFFFVLFLFLHCSFKKAFLSLLASLWNSAFHWEYLFLFPFPFASLLFSAICKSSSNNHFAFLYFFFLEMVLVTASCTMFQTSFHSSSSTLSTRSNPLNLFLTSTV